MNIKQNNPDVDRTRDDAAVQRGRHLLAKIRNRQLMLARQGKVTESANYARRASRLRDFTELAA